MLFTSLVDVESLRALLGRDPVVLVDCRFDLGDAGAGRRAYLTAHLPGARYADLNRELAAPVTAASGRHPLPDPAALAQFFGSLGISDTTQVVVYDQANGSFAARAWWLLRWLGHSAVAVLDGGFEAWVRAGGVVEAALPQVTATRFSQRLHPESVATAADVLLVPSHPETLVVDARAAERFAGSVEPLDPVAGHVPGAVNHPFAGNLREDGHFLEPEELRRRWLERLAGRAPRDVILMCGSGVTACHNLLAMESYHGTTIVSVRRGNVVALGGDGQVTLGNLVIKATARKVRRLHHDGVLAGFAGATADAFTLFERFEAKLEKHQGNLVRAAIELTKDWRTDRVLRRLEAMLAVADRESSLIITGNGDVLEPEYGIVSIGSGGSYASAAARALLQHTDMAPKDIVKRSLEIAADLCIYTNQNHTIEMLE